MAYAPARVASVVAVDGPQFFHFIARCPFFKDYCNRIMLYFTMLILNAYDML
jgi:hypothetical protein